MEVQMDADTMDQANRSAGGVARMAASLVAFTANVQVGTPEVHLAYDMSPGASEREFLEVFLPDQRGGGLPPGRFVVVDDLLSLFEAFADAAEASRLSRALHHYEVALRSWYFGGEWLSLSHLYMAVEALTKAEMRTECKLRGQSEEELARACGIDPTGDRWRSELAVWCRLNLTFEGDKATYSGARAASDGIEHGFMELDEVHVAAMELTEKCFGYVRRATLRLLGLPLDSPLAKLAPLDVFSVRRMVRGRLVGAVEDPNGLAPPGEEYPILIWRSHLRSATRLEDRVDVSSHEDLKVNTAPGVEFSGDSFEVRGRLTPGQTTVTSAIDTSAQADTPLSPADHGARAEELALKVTSAVTFAATGLDGAKELPTLRLPVFDLFAEVLGLGEAISGLLAASRPLEATYLLRPLLEGTCLLQTMADPSEGHIQTVTVHLARYKDVIEDDQISEDVRHQAQDWSSKFESAATSRGIAVADSERPWTEAPFYESNTGDIEFIKRLASVGGIAGQLHREQSKDGVLAMSTHFHDHAFSKEIASLSIKCIVESSRATAAALGWEVDEAEASRLVAVAETLCD